MEPVRIAVVGLGRGFMLTLPALRAHPGVRLAGAFDVRSEARARFEESFGTPAFDNLTDLLAAPDIDAVYIATPHELHAEQAIAAMTAGKHVLVEKPMAHTIRDCVEMEAAAARTGRILVVGPSHGFDAPVRLAAELVASGDHGAVRLVTAFNFTDFMYRPRRPEELDTNRGGGVVYSQAAHQIDVVRRLVGQPVRSLRAVAGNWDPARLSEGAYSMLMTFAGGAAATLTYSGYGHYDSDELVGWVSELGRRKDPQRHGDARRALAAIPPGGEAKAKEARTFSATSAPESPPPHHEHFGFVLVSCERADIRITPTELIVYGDERRDRIPIAPPTLPRAEVIGDFIDAVRGVRPSVHDGRWGLGTMACCAALLESSRSGREVSPDDMIASVDGDIAK